MYVAFCFPPSASQYNPLSVHRGQGAGGEVEGIVLICCTPRDTSTLGSYSQYVE